MNKRSRQVLLGAVVGLFLLIYFSDSNIPMDTGFPISVGMFLFITFMDKILSEKGKKSDLPYLIPCYQAWSEARTMNAHDWIEGGFGEAFESLKNTVKYSNSNNLTWLLLKKYRGELHYLKLNGTSNPTTTRCLSSGLLNDWSLYHEELAKLSKEGVPPVEISKLDILEGVKEMELSDEAQAEAMKNLSNGRKENEN